MPDDPARVLVLRGHHATPWELKPWEGLPDRFEVSYLRTRRNMFDVGAVRLRAIPARTLAGLFPGGRLGSTLTGLLGDRYLGASRHLAGADVVSAEELNFWFTEQAAKLKARHGYRLVTTVWETLPMLDAYRNPHARLYRRRAIEATDLFLPATERARDALLLEGVPAERIELCPPGIDLERFRAAASPNAPSGRHLVLSPGRLVWEKGHHDVLRAVAALHGGIVRGAGGGAQPGLLIVGSGPEEKRLMEHAAELGIAEAVEFRRMVPYEEMPAVYASASCMVLASLSAASTLPPLSGRPRVFWEEQFGMVLVEAMAAGLPILASTCGAIPEVAGPSATYFAPGDWMGLARALAEGPLSRPLGERVGHPAERLEAYSIEAMAGRLAAAYDKVLG